MESYNPIGKPAARSEPVDVVIPDYIRGTTFPIINSHFVAVMSMKTANRGMVASEFHTRCVQQGEVHELICQYENSQGHVEFNDAWYLGFIEFTQGCVLAKGMQVEANGKSIGRVVGFDMTHMPNHMNILLASPLPQTGKEHAVSPGHKCYFTAKAA